MKGTSGLDLTNIASNASPSVRGEETPMLRNISPLGQMLDRNDYLGGRVSDYGGTVGDHNDDKTPALSKRKLSNNAIQSIKKKKMSDYQINVEPIGKPSHHDDLLSLENEILEIIKH